MSRADVEDVLRPSCTPKGTLQRDAWSSILRSVSVGQINDSMIDSLLDAAGANDEELSLDAVLDVVYGECSNSQAAVGSVSSISGSRAAEASALAVQPGDNHCGFGTPAIGCGQVYLAGFKGRAPHVEWRVEEKAEASFANSIQEFRSTYEDQTALTTQLANRVRVCAQCEKPCASILTRCNACGADISVIEVTTSDNVFMAFAYGIASGKFKFEISLRAQSEDFLCFDDPLAMSPCHVNVIPTSVYIPDFRYLFADPSRGLALINSLFDLASSVVREQFLGCEEFRRGYFSRLTGNASKTESSTVSEDELAKMVATGMNFPPSQFQLHLQFILLPLLPFHHARLLADGHLTYGRFFPLDYLQKALALGDAVRMPVNSDTKVESIMEAVAAHGVNYDEAFGAMHRRCREMQRQLSAWREEDFEYQVVNDRVISADILKWRPDRTPKQLQADDTKALQNYGRPYDEAGRPSGTYYRHAKKPGQIPSFVPAT